MEPLEVEFLDPTAKQQLLDLPSNALKLRALQLLAKVANKNPRLGKPCGFRHSTGNISDCRKLYFDEREDVEPRYRIVYRLVPNEDEPEKIEVVRIGLKVTFAEDETLSIYHEVGRALGRLLDQS